MEAEQISKEERQRKEEARKKIAQLVYKFKQDIVDTGRIKNYNEEQTKVSFITPLFKALGWRMDDHHEVLYEETIFGKRADYLFRLNGKRSMIVEAKQPSRSLALGTISGDSVAKQVVSYAWHTQIPIAVATDFEELLVYHALTKPLTISKNLMLIENKDFSLKFTDFIDKFELLWLLSKDSFENNRLDKYLKKDAKKHKTVDKSILEDLVHFRNWLAKDIKKYNQNLAQEEIDEVVQKLIDRLIFIRSVEDRGLENRKDWLLSIVEDIKHQRLLKKVIVELRSVFEHFDNVYNSKLFAKSRIDKDVVVSDEILSKVVYGLYFGTGSGRFKYEFDKISVDLLGSIYEQYLGMLLRSTEKRIKLEEGKSKRKKMGIYYTPQYIVDYIVKNTIGEYMKGKSLKELEDIKILDPACGSGSFLQRAYDEVKEEVKRRIEKGETNGIFDELETVGDEKKLFLGQKQQVILRNIHGVDLDDQAVEIAQLSLLLKLLEGESSNTKKKRLPMLKNNIQCGNSLIDDYEVAGDKAFKWQSRFKDIVASGGFNIVIGNPPYGAELSKEHQTYLNKEYNIGSTDTAILFIKEAFELLDTGGRLSFIVPKALCFSSNYKKIRAYIKDYLEILIDCGKVWREVKLEQVIFVLKKGRKSNSYSSGKLNGNTIEILGKIDKKDIDEFGFFLNSVSPEEVNLAKKIKSKSIVLNDIGQNRRGAMLQKSITNDGDYDVIGGAQVQRYGIKGVKGRVHKTKLDSDQAHINNNSILVQNIVAHIENPIDHIKIIASVVHDKNQIILDTINQITLENKYSPKYIWCILNSSFMNWYAYRFIFGKAIRTMHFDNAVTSRIPMRELSPEQQKPFIKLADRMLNLNKQLQEEKSDTKQDLIKRQIEQTDDAINQMIYKLYGLTEAEKKIIEDSLR
jgi:hypothetical protein